MVYRFLGSLAMALAVAFSLNDRITFASLPDVMRFVEHDTVADPLAAIVEEPRD